VNVERPLFRINKPLQSTSTSKTPVVTKKQPEKTPEKVDKNSILMEYKQYIDTLDKSSSYKYSQDTIENPGSTFLALVLTL
jgi:hypothetical protein